jgi:hypothetical protein
MGSGNDELWNMVSIGLLVATGIVLIIFVIMGFSKSTGDVSVVPTVRVAPSITPTYTPTITRTPLPPTFTPTFTPSFTPTPGPTATIPPTNTPAPIPTETITPTPSPTETLDVTLTNTPTETPTGPTPTPPSAFPFAGPDAPQFTRNFANTAGCAWQGIGGTVTDINGNAFANPLQVHVYSQQQDFGRVLTGTNSSYGPAGFEVRVANNINRQTYFVRLESQGGTALSPVVQFTFPGDCEQNVAIVNFEQTRSLAP